MEFIGMEAVVVLPHDELNDITGASLNIIAYAPATIGDLEFMWMGLNTCAESGCMARQTNGFTGINIPADLGYAPSVIIDSIDDIWPPTSLTLRLVCP